MVVAHGRGPFKGAAGSDLPAAVRRQAMECDKGRQIHARLRREPVGAAATTRIAAVHRHAMPLESSSRGMIQVMRTTPTVVAVDDGRLDMRLHAVEQ
eukprot:8743507-Alexandrium_andersonii.AAC.1